jgi:hypothetical protein
MGGIGDAETVDVVTWTRGTPGTVVDFSRGRIRHDRETEKTSPRALIRAPVSSRATSLVDAEVLGNPMDIQKAQDKEHDSYQAHERKDHQDERGHAVERGGLPMTPAPGLLEHRQRLRRHSNADVTPELGPSGCSRWRPIFRVKVGGRSSAGGGC